MKKIIWFILCLSSLGAYAQKASNITIDTSYKSSPFSVYIKNKADTINRQVIGSYSSGQNDRIPTYSQMRTYVANNVPSPIINGGQILVLPVVGQTIPTGTPNQVWNSMYRPPLPPTATLTGGNINQYGGSAITHTLSLSYGRQATTATINNPVVFNPGSINKFTTQPAQPGTVSGTQSVTTPANTNVTYSLSVTDANTFNTTVTTTDTWFPFYYVGTCGGTTPTSAEVLASTTKTFGFGTSYDMNFTFSGSNLHVFYAYYNSYPTATSVKDAAGNEAIAAMTLSSLSLTDNGFTGTWKTVTTNNTYSNATIVLHIRP